MGEFVMPSLGADMEAGTLLEWHVKPGDTVKRGDLVALVDTSKAAIEVEIFEDGVIDELLVKVGERVPVGTPLAIVSAAGEEVTPAETAPSQAAVPEPGVPEPVGVAAGPPEAAVAAPVGVAPAPPEPVLVAAGAPAAPVHRLRVSPLARRVADALGVDLATVQGSGPDGAIVRADVERRAGSVTPAAGVAAEVPVAPVAAPTAAPPAPAVAAPTVTPATPPATAPVAAPPETGPNGIPVPDRRAAMREAIAALMARSKREIPHYYLQLEIDFSRARAWLDEANVARPVEERLLPAALLLSATARAAAAVPALNGFWVDGGFHAGQGVHLGVAVALRGGGLIAPALHDADRRSLDEIMAGVRDLVARARAGRLRGSEMSDPTITVTNLGDRGSDLVHGVIYAPQVALVGFGGVRERPWASEGMLGVRPTVIATLAGDHRATDGHTGSRFLSLIDRYLQTPEDL